MARTKVTNPEGLKLFTEEQIERTQGSPDIFLKEGVNVPQGANQGFFRTIESPVAPSVPNIVNDTTNNSIVDGSTEARQDSGAVKIDANNLTKDMDDFSEIEDAKNGLVKDALGQQVLSKESQTAFTNFKSLLKNIGVFTTEEDEEITKAGEGIGAQFDVIINKAKEARRKGLPKALIGGGQRGGLMSTQIAGASAVAQTEGESFFGAGGELANIESVFDSNIEALESQKITAVNTAKALARKAIRTGKSQDLTNAKSLFDIAQKAQEASNELTLTKIKLLSDLESQKQEDIAFDFDIRSQIPEGTTVNIGGEDFEGIAIPEPEKAFFSGGNIIALMGKIPRGETQIVTDPNTGQEFTLTGTQDPNIVTSTDNAGNVSGIDKTTGEVLWKAQGAGKSKTPTKKTDKDLTADLPNLQDFAKELGDANNISLDINSPEVKSAFDEEIARLKQEQEIETDDEKGRRIITANPDDTRERLKTKLLSAGVNSTFVNALLDELKPKEDKDDGEDEAFLKFLKGE